MKPLAEAAGESFASSVAPVLPVVIVAWRPGAVGSSAAGEGIALAHQDRYLLFGRLVV